MAKLHKISEACSNPMRDADVLFIHGLGGDASRTWRHGDGIDTSWPHWLAEAFPSVGVWSLAHAATPTYWPNRLGRFKFWRKEIEQAADCSAALPDSADEVVRLMHLDRDFRGNRPLVLVCHSLGGLLAKAILRSSVDNKHPRDTQSVATRVSGVMFLATPHNGARLASIADAFGAIFGSTASVSALKAHDAHLRNLYNWYCDNAETLGIRTETFFEGLDTKGFRIVDETTAQPGVRPRAVKLNQDDHLSIAKPRERDSQVCMALEDLLRETLKNSGPTTQSRTERDKNLSVVRRLKYTTEIELTDPQGLLAKYVKRVRNQSLISGHMEYSERLEGSGSIKNVRTEPYVIRGHRTVAGGTRFLSVFPSTYSVGDIFNGVLSADLVDCFTASVEEWSEHIQVETEELQITIRFPLQRPCLLIRPVKYDSARVKPTPPLPSEGRPKLSPDQLTATWSIDKPEVGFIYGLEWDW